ncbi:GTP 3',8-cyclase MoaA [Desulfofalx alkaliphila]|uniref:GTP 3',8-cyclase MoaA n=1 Tax=Desulfofalx alkaliphila TaxID=105483 RepID=UPI0004E27D95|nr:GTP 3',8-cyclase MoaA [Desulfofalx alkaliphila]
MQDGYKRDINYLRISVTDRCNLRCLYCMPPEGVEMVDHQEILSLEEIYRVVEAGTLVGIRKIRLTGGEPLVRLGLVGLIDRISKLPQIDDIAITTNGLLLKEMGKDLKKAGLRRVNISLDTMRPMLYRKITRIGRLEKAMEGIETALTLGLNPVKINTVVIRGVNSDEVVDFARWTKEAPVHVRFIELMPIGTSSPWAAENFVPAEEIQRVITDKLGLLQEEKNLAGSGPAKYYRLAGAPGTIGFITAMSDHFCAKCNRLRLTANGYLRPCLFSNGEVEIKTALRSGIGTEELAKIIASTVMLKPDRHHMDYGWNDARVMSQIGG